MRASVGNGRIGTAMVAAAFALAAASASAINASDRYRSPRNPERRIRQTTELIVLHTTEAPARSSLNKVSDRGECHFVVTEDGSVYRIVDRDREAFHAGRSMWNGREDVDKFSIGIECVGYHDKVMPIVQIAAIRDLVKELKGMYRITDDRVVCHSHVAYGAPNKWHPRRHRGRKQCGMLFAMPSVRRQLGLKVRPGSDPDTRAGRLVVGDPYLQKVLYGNVDTMSRAYAKSPVQSSGGFLAWFKKKTDPHQPLVQKKGSVPAQVKGSVPTRVKAQGTVPNGSRVVSAKTKQKQTVLPKTPVVSGKGTAPKVVPRSVAELRAKGYRLLGTVSPGVTAIKLAGAKWNAADTYYSIRNKVISGRSIDAAHIEKGMSVWRPKGK